MRSPMITNASYILDKDDYGDLEVLRSAAGFFIGTSYRGEPGSRDSDYYPTEAAAQADLDRLCAGESLPLRTHP